MKQHRIITSLLLCGAMSISLLTGCGTAAQSSSDTAANDTGSSALSIADQGIFSAGGITLTSDGTFDPENQWEESGAGQTAHVDQSAQKRSISAGTHSSASAAGKTASLSQMKDLSFLTTMLQSISSSVR